MIEIIILELISLVSFIYSLFLLFVDFSPLNELAYVFLWTVIISIVISLYIHKSKLYNLFILILLLPLLFLKDFKYILLILSSAIIILLYIKSSLGKGKYLEYVSMFKKSSILYAILLYIKMLSTQFGWFLGEESLFLILYLTSSIVLIRSIRHLDTNMDNGSMRNSNRKYILGLILVFAMGTMDALKDIAFKLGNKAFELMEYGVYLVVYPINKFMYWLFNIFQDMEAEPEEIIFGENTVPNISEPETIEDFAKYVQRNFLILKIIAGVILFLVVIYILYKLLIKNAHKDYTGIEYTEHREFIKDKKGKRKPLFGEKYPKEPKEQIRYYYRKFLEKLSKQEIHILEQDTSLDVNIKAKEIFGENADEIRKIYISSRYSDKEVSPKEVDHMKSIYKNL